MTDVSTASAAVIFRVELFSNVFFFFIHTSVSFAYQLVFVSDRTLQSCVDIVQSLTKKDLVNHQGRNYRGAGGLFLPYTHEIVCRKFPFLFGNFHASS